MTRARINLLAGLAVGATLGLVGGVVANVSGQAGEKPSAAFEKSPPPCDGIMVIDLIQQEQKFSISVGPGQGGYPSIMMHPYPADGVISPNNCAFHGYVNLPPKEGEGIPFTLYEYKPGDFQ